MKRIWRRNLAKLSELVQQLGDVTARLAIGAGNTPLPSPAVPALI